MFSRWLSASPVLRRVARRFGWGLADQAMSSVSNAAVSFYVARELGATQFGAFSLAYVTYSFALNASRGLATDPLVVRYSNADPAAWRRAVAQQHRDRGDRRPGGRRLRHGRGHGAARHAAGSPSSRSAWRCPVCCCRTAGGTRSSRSAGAATPSSTTRCGRCRCCPRWGCCASRTTAPCSGSSWPGARRPTVAACVGPLQARTLPRLASALDVGLAHPGPGAPLPGGERRQQRRRPAAHLRRRHHRGPGRGRLPAGRPAAAGPVHGGAHGDIAGHCARGGAGTASLASSSRAVLPRGRGRSCRHGAGLGSVPAGGAASRPGLPAARQPLEARLRDWCCRSRSASWARASKSGRPRACMPSGPPGEACGR